MADDGTPLHSRFSNDAAVAARKRIGRGALSNPAGRFEALRYEFDADAVDGEPDPGPAPRTHFLRDDSRSIVSYNESPDLGLSAGVNPYRGCEHGCAYCYARPTHEYLGLSAGLDFETRIMVKVHAPDLLRAELSSSAWKPQPIAMSGVTDCYQPAERGFKLTRRCLQVLAEFRNPVVVITKNHLVTRDIDVLQELAAQRAAAIYVSVTTLDADLARAMEPRTASPGHRLDAIQKLSSAGIPTGVLMAPVIPVLTESEMSAVLAAAREAGAHFCSWSLLRLPLAVKGLFREWLEAYAPGKAAAVLSRIRAMRGGKLNESDFGSRFSGQGIYADRIRQTFEIARRRYGFGDPPVLNVGDFRRPAGPQMTLFD